VSDAASQAAIDADAAWRAAIAALYEMTRDDRRRGPVEGCEHCVSEDAARALGEIPREQAPERLMDRYGFKALTTWGNERDLRWFLPRLVELLALEPDRIANARIVAGKVVMAGFDDWPEEERATVRAAFLALWRLWLDGGRPWRRPWCDPVSRGALRPDAILPGIAVLGIDIAPLLDDLAARAHGDRALADEYLDLAELVAYHELDDADDPYDVGGRAAPRYFLTSGAVGRVEALAVHYAEAADLGEPLMMVAEHLERRRAKRAAARIRR
jgi:hypothetical protein